MMTEKENFIQLKKNNILRIGIKDKYSNVNNQDKNVLK